MRASSTLAPALVLLVSCGPTSTAPVVSPAPSGTTVSSPPPTSSVAAAPPAPPAPTPDPTPPAIAKARPLVPTPEDDNLPKAPAGAAIIHEGTQCFMIAHPPCSGACNPPPPMQKSRVRCAPPSESRP